MLYSRAVPNDSADYILDALRSILCRRSSSASFIRVIYTDNIARDKPGIQKLFRELFPDKEVNTKLQSTSVVDFYFVLAS